MNNDWFFEKFALIADAPGAVERMRGLVLDWALSGKFSQKSEVPFKYVRLDSVADIRMGNSPPGHSYNETGQGVPLINGPVEFSSGPLGLTVRTKFTTSPTKLCKRGDLLICVRGSTTGRTNIAAFDACIGRGVAAITAHDNQIYINLFVWSQRAKIFALGTGSTFPSISYDDLASLELTLPPLAEQKRIVAMVHELMGLCDALEAQQQERESRKSVLVRASLSRFAESPTPENLGYLFHKSYHIPPSELRKSILTLAVQGKLVPQDPNDEPADSSPGIDAFFEIPASWRWKALGVLGRCRTGKTPPTSDTRNFGTGFPFIGPGQITRNGHITGSEKTITNKGLENCTEAKDYDILMVCIGGSIGKAAISREVLGFNQQINSLRLKRDLPEFVYLAITSEYFQSQVLANASGSATPIINKGKWERIPVPIPPLAEQRRIVAKVDQLMALVDELERQQEASREKASKLLDAIVQEMTSGGRDIAAT